MKRTAGVLLSLLLAVVPLWAADPKISGETKVAPNRLVKLTVDNLPDGAVVFWDVIDARDTADTDETSARLVFTGPNGSYRVKARIVWQEGKGLRSATLSTTAIIGGDVPPGPAPGPGPVPDPTPIPSPSDPLWVSLSAAFKADGSPVVTVKKLAAVYRQAAIDGGTVDDKSLQTRGQLYAILAAAGQTVAPNPALAETRKVVAAELSRVLGQGADDPLTDELRGKHKGQFIRIAGLLDQLR